jgi:hypothetical protein
MTVEQVVSLGENKIDSQSHAQDNDKIAAERRELTKLSYRSLTRLSLTNAEMGTNNASELQNIVLYLLNVAEN